MPMSDYEPQDSTVDGEDKACIGIVTGRAALADQARRGL